MSNATLLFRRLLSIPRSKIPTLSAICPLAPRTESYLSADRQATLESHSFSIRQWSEPRTLWEITVGGAPR